jgi:hypothetical protein
MMVIWLMTFMLIITLYFDVLKKVLNIGEVVGNLMPKKKKK